MCTHRGPFNDPDGHLVCTTTDPGHDEDAPTGHTYEVGSWVDDHHPDGGHG